MIDQADEFMWDQFGSQRLLSQEYEKFLDYAIAQRHCLEPLQLLDDDLPPLLRHYEYGLNSWPVFISPQLKQQLARCAISIPLLLPKVFETAFNSDPHEMANFYGITTEFAELMLRTLPRIDLVSGLVSRSDSVMTADGLKTLEINFGTSVGGWQIQFMDRQYRKQPPLNEFLGSLSQCDSRNILHAYYSQLVRACSALKEPGDGNLTWLFVATDVFFKLGGDRTLIELFSRFAADDGISLSVEFARDMSGISVGGGQVIYKEARIHALLVGGQPSNKFRSDVLDVFIDGNVVWPDNPFVEVLSDKRNLALLHLHRDHATFSESERADIARHIPWSAVASPGSVTFRGAEWDLQQLLLAHQEKFVIKPSMGARGVDVCVGKYASRADWQDSVKRSFDSGRYVIQEFCESLSFFAQGSTGGVCAVDYIWGIFAFAERYGGVWIRMMPKDGTGDGVINSSRGAQETIVYEVAC